MSPFRMDRWTIRSIAVVSPEAFIDPAACRGDKGLRSIVIGRFFVQMPLQRLVPSALLAFEYPFVLHSPFFRLFLFFIATAAAVMPSAVVIVVVMSCTLQLTLREPIVGDMDVFELRWSRQWADARFGCVQEEANSSVKEVGGKEE